MSGALEAKRLGCLYDRRFGVVRGEDYQPDHSRRAEWAVKVGGPGRLEASPAAVAIFAVLPPFTRQFLATSAPWSLKLPHSVALQLEFHDMLDGDALNRLGAEVFWLAWSEFFDNVNGWFTAFVR